MTFMDALVSLGIGLLGGWMLWRYQRSKIARVRQKIADLEYQEKLVDSLSLGYQNLLRYTFKKLAFAFSIVFFSIGVMLFFKALPYSWANVAFMLSWYVGVPMFFASGAICYSVFKDISSLSNLKDTKESMRNKKEKLENKLNTLK